MKLWHPRDPHPHSHWLSEAPEQLPCPFLQHELSKMGPAGREGCSGKLLCFCLISGETQSPAIGQRKISIVPCSPHPPPLASPLLPNPTCSIVFPLTTHTWLQQPLQNNSLFCCCWGRRTQQKKQEVTKCHSLPQIQTPLCTFAPVDCSIVIPIPQQGLPSITASLQALRATKKQPEGEKSIPRSQSWAQQRGLQGRNTLWLLDGREKGGAEVCQLLGEKEE